MTEPTPLSPGMARMLYVASGLVCGVGLNLCLFGDRTDTLFAFTIQPPVTAAFLGANYLASGLLELLAARERQWARARIAVPSVLVFTTAAFVATLRGWAYLHLGNPLTWVWIAVYAIVPVVMGLLWWRQLRVPGAEPARVAPLPLWLRGLLFAEGGLVALIGLCFFFDVTFDGWPWSLLTRLPGVSYGVSQAPYVGCWLMGLGVSSLHAALENDFVRLKPFFASALALGALQIGTLIRYRSSLDLSGVGATLFGLVLATSLVAGATGLWTLRRSGRTAAA